MLRNKIIAIFRMGILAIRYFAVVAKCKLFKTRSNVWLIAEDGHRARDNGIVLYSYIKQNHPEISIKFVIDKESADVKEVDAGDILPFRSAKHLELLYVSPVLISTHHMGYTPDQRLFSRLNAKGLFPHKGKQVFLQHGITKDFIDALSPKKTKIDILVCGAKDEYDYFLEKYGYSKKVAKLTGFARYDLLKDSKKSNTIAVIPTWRKWLRYENNFKRTEYFKKWNAFINDPRLLEYARDNKMKIIFYPHTEIGDRVKEFSIPSGNIVRIADYRKDDIRDIIRESDYLITDYSSVFFDFAYQGKPVIYYQFDYDRYRAEQYGEGYFDYVKNGFGPVCKTLDDVIGNLGYNTTKYQKRSSDFFPERDGENCKRILAEIRKIVHEQ